MRTPSDRPLAVRIVGTTRAEASLSSGQVAAAAGITAERLAWLVRLGLVEPVAPGADVFAAAEVARLRRMLRLRRDLGVNLLGAAILVDLLERLDGLEAELARLQNR